VADTHFPLLWADQLGRLGCPIRLPRRAASKLTSPPCTSPAGHHRCRARGRVRPLLRALLEPGQQAIERRGGSAAVVSRRDGHRLPRAPSCISGACLLLHAVCERKRIPRVVCLRRCPTPIVAREPPSCASSQQGFESLPDSTPAESIGQCLNLRVAGTVLLTLSMTWKTDLTSCRTFLSDVTALQSTAKLWRSLGLWSLFGP
jgi:hypothetical protein